MKSNHYSNHNRLYKGDNANSFSSNVICIAALADDGNKFVNKKGLQRAAKQIEKGGAKGRKRIPRISISEEINTAFHELGKGGHTALHRIGHLFMTLQRYGCYHGCTFFDGQIAVHEYNFRYTIKFTHMAKQYYKRKGRPFQPIKLPAEKEKEFAQREAEIANKMRRQRQPGPEPRRMLPGYSKKHGYYSMEKIEIVLAAPPVDTKEIAASEPLVFPKPLLAFSSVRVSKNGRLLQTRAVKVASFSLAGISLLRAIGTPKALFL